MGTTKRFEVIFSTLHIEPLLFAVSKKNVYGAPTELNYPAMIYTLVARIVERIPTIKDLRLQHDFMFHLECGFLFSDRIPSEASFSRFTQKSSESNALDMVQETLLPQAIQEDFIHDDIVDTGIVRIGSNVKIGYLTQHVFQYIGDEKLIDVFCSEVTMNKGVLEIY